MRGYKQQPLLSLVIAAVLLVTFVTRAAIAADEDHATTPTLSAAERQTFQEKMLAIPLPGTGCYFARYSDPHWQKVKCGTPPKTPNPMARGPKPYFVGNGTDYFAQSGNLITSATGSFDAVTNVTSEYGPTYYS